MKEKELEKLKKDLNTKHLIITNNNENGLNFKFNTIPILLIIFSGLFIPTTIIVCFNCFLKEKALNVNLFNEVCFLF